MDLLQYDYAGVTGIKDGLTREQINKAAGALDAARAEVLDDVDLRRSGQPVPKAKQPLDSEFIDLPERLLDAYHREGDASELGRILQCADYLAGEVDRAVLLGIGGSYIGAKALFDACCHAYHNELPRALRHERPRIYFEGNNVDNDAAAELIGLLKHPGVSPESCWALIVISKSGGTTETAVALRRFLSVLRESCAHDDEVVAHRVVPITGCRDSKLRKTAEALKCPAIFPVPDGVGGRFSVLSAVGLLPAALMGLDVVALLEGAAAINRHFRAEPPGRNRVLDFAAVGHLAETHFGATIRVLSVWSKKAESLGLWYDQLLAESLGKQERGATPITAVGTRDLHSRGQQHQEGRRDKLITNLVIRQPRDKPLEIGPEDPPVSRPDEPDYLVGKTYPDVMSAAVTGTNEAYAEVNRPTATIALPRLDEASLGQLMQMLMLATVVEGYWMGINPYGQPGVVSYKQHMIAELKKSSKGAHA